MSDLTVDIPKGTLTKDETILYLMEIDNRFCIEPSVMRNAIYSACHYLDEESAKEPQEYNWKKEKVFPFCWKCECGYTQESRYVGQKFCSGCGRKVKVIE